MLSKMRNRDLVKQVSSFRVRSSATDEAIKGFLQSLDSPRSLAVWILYETGEHQQLVDLEVNPLDFCEDVEFRDAYLATNFLAKADFLKLAVSKKDAAIKKFLEFENLCHDTNRRFLNLHLDPLFTSVHARLLMATRCKIVKILGSFSAEEFVNGANWGPGVTTLLKGEEVSPFNKFQSETGITRDLYSLVRGWFQSAYPMWSCHLSRVGPDLVGPPVENDGFTLERGNRVVTVPKNSKTDRVIAVEPGVNLWFQKAIGTMIRSRLGRYGVNLNRQDKNQQFAHEGAFDGHLATVDFSSASDSIAKNVIRELIPHEWLQLMESTRSVVGFHGEDLIRWEKFASMGNGFTFELESLIFFAAALAVCEEHRIAASDVSVYGDDVILPSSCFTLYSEFCAFLGFKVNPKKSFSSGNFRESCGAHYFGALDCKPLYLKGKLSNVQTIYKLANGIRLLAHRCRRNNGCDERFLDAWHHLLRRVPKHLRFRCPLGIGDVGFIGNFDEACPSTPGRGFEGFLVRGLFEVGVTRQSELPGMLLARIRGSHELAYGNNYTLRGRTRIAVSNILVRSWYNLGSWA